jgi:hypothetical protein
MVQIWTMDVRTNKRAMGRHQRIPLVPDRDAVNRSAMRNLTRAVWAMGAATIDRSSTAFDFAATEAPAAAGRRARRDRSQRSN